MAIYIRFTCLWAAGDWLLRRPITHDARGDVVKAVLFQVGAKPQITVKAPACLPVRDKMPADSWTRLSSDCVPGACAGNTGRVTPIQRQAFGCLWIQTDRNTAPHPRLSGYGIVPCIRKVMNLKRPLAGPGAVANPRLPSLVRHFG